MTEGEPTADAAAMAESEPAADAVPTTEAEPFPHRVTAPLLPGLYLVPTPIGNLEDITLRALRVLRGADRIACEDTRQTQKLLNHFRITTPTVSYHLHNERERAGELVTALKSGGRIAIVSDAGMPGIADPGALLVTAALAAGVPVVALPGANAALTALVASGLDGEHFQFRGFLPSKAGERKTVLEAVRAAMSPLPAAVPAVRPATPAAGAATQIFYETPHRILDALRDIVAVFGEMHRIALARELTKLHEEYLRGTAAEVLATLSARDVIRGEMVLLLDGSPQQAVSAESGSLAEAVRALMTTESLPEKDALKRVAKERNIGKSDAYREWQRANRRS